MRNITYAMLAVSDFMASIALLAAYVLFGVACTAYFSAAIIDPDMRWLYRQELEWVVLSGIAIGALFSLRQGVRAVLLNNPTGTKALRLTMHWRGSKAILAFAIAAGALAAMSMPSRAAGASSLPVHWGFMDERSMRWYANNDDGVWIENSSGGHVDAAIVLKKAKRLIISGYCQSACAWAFVMHPNACYTRTARFAFHAAHRPNGTRASWMTAKLVNYVRPGLWHSARLTIYFSNPVHISPRKWDEVYGDRKCGWR